MAIDGSIAQNIGIAICTSLLVFTIRVVIVLRQIEAARKNKRSYSSMLNKQMHPVNTLVVLGSGGHTTEMLHLLSSINNYENYAPLNYIIASSDTTSKNRLEALNNSAANAQEDDATLKSKNTIKLPPHCRIYKIPRAREVGQSYPSSIFTTLQSILYTGHLILFRVQPDLLLMNGPGTCLPIALWTFIGRVLGLSLGNIVFVESFCRVKSLSLTGKILRKLGIVDLFLVHWPELLRNCSDSKNSGWGEEGIVLVDCFMKHDADDDMK